MLERDLSIVRLSSKLRQVIAVRNHLSGIELFEELGIGIGDRLPVPVCIVVDHVLEEFEADAVRCGRGQVDAVILGLATRQVAIEDVCGLSSVVR